MSMISVNHFSPSRSQTHPSLPQGKEQVTLPMNFSPLSFSPVGERLVTFVLSKTSSANHFSPLSFSPVGERLVTPFCQRLGVACLSILQIYFLFSND